MNIEEIFFSRGIVKILHKLSIEGEINISQLSRGLGLNHMQTKNYLEYLKKMNLVKEKRFGKIRIFSCNEEDKYMKLIIQFMNQWQRINRGE
jgi:DNA-binding transcriptional ArsR family regulator